jgi:hypothetical protein
VPRQFKDYRLGASTQGLHYEQPPMQGLGPRARGGLIPWAEVYYDGRRILGGRVSLPIANPAMGELFDPDEFGPWIAAHIPPANLLTPDQLTIRAMRAAGPGTWIAVALLVVAFAGIAWWITSL